MSAEKTEQPTPHKLKEAAKEGQVPHSKDFTQTVLVVSLFGYTLANAENIVREMGEMILMPATLHGSDFSLAADILTSRLLRAGLELLAPYLIIVIVLGLVVEYWQTGMNISFKAASPSFKKLDVVQNAKNIFSAKNIFEFFKSIVKIILLSVIVYYILRRALPTLFTIPYGGLTAVGVATAVLLQTMMLQVSMGYIVLSVADLLWQRRNHIKQLMMSKDEVMREFKDQEGDPHIKHKRKELRRELVEDHQAQRTQMSNLVVSNPTHLAIAIAYRPGLTPLPIVVAMGADAVALRMIEVARRLGIPVVQNIPLAHALMGQAQLDEYIPSDLIEPVAQLLRVVVDLKAQEEH